MNTRSSSSKHIAQSFEDNCSYLSNKLSSSDLPTRKRHRQTHALEKQFSVPAKANKKKSADIETMLEEALKERSTGNLQIKKAKS